MTTLPPGHLVGAPPWTIRPERPVDIDQIHDLRSPYDEAGPAYQVRAIGDTPLESGTVEYPPAFSQL